ncbi:MAG: hypothetical protein WAM88_02785 [Nitrososphaeraceae archaeon]
MALRPPDYDEVCGTGEGGEEVKPLPELGEDTSEDTAKDEDAEDQPRFGGDQFFDESDDSDNNEIENSDSEANSVTVKKTNHSLDKTNYLPFFRFRE